VGRRSHFRGRDPQAISFGGNSVEVLRFLFSDGAVGLVCKRRHFFAPSADGIQCQASARDLSPTASKLGKASS